MLLISRAFTMSLPIALVAGMQILCFQESSMNLLLSVTFVFTCYPLTARIYPWPFLMGALCLCCRSSKGSSTITRYSSIGFSRTRLDRESIRRFNPAKLEVPHKDLSDICEVVSSTPFPVDCKINYTLHSLFSVTRLRLWYYPESINLLSNFFWNLA